MTTRQIDAWDFFIKKVCPVLSIAGTLLYICFYVGSHFGVIEKSQDEFRTDIKDLKTNVSTIREDFNSFKSKYNTDRVTDSLKRQIGTYSTGAISNRMLGYYRDANGKIHSYPTTN